MKQFLHVSDIGDLKAGLYLSREIAQNHGGDIQAKSVKDEYSEFIITIPIKKV